MHIALALHTTLLILQVNAVTPQLRFIAFRSPVEKMKKIMFNKTHTIHTIL